MLSRVWDLGFMVQGSGVRVWASPVTFLEAQSKNQTAREVGQLPAAQGQIAVSPVGLGLTKLDPKKPLVPKKPPSSSPASERWAWGLGFRVLEFRVLFKVYLNLLRGRFLKDTTIYCRVVGGLLPLASPLPRDHHPTVLAHRPRTFLTSVSEALTARQVPVSTRAKPTCMYLVCFSDWPSTPLTPQNKQLP